MDISWLVGWIYQARNVKCRPMRADPLLQLDRSLVHAAFFLSEHWPDPFSLENCQVTVVHWPDSFLPGNSQDKTVWRRHTPFDSLRISQIDSALRSGRRRQTEIRGVKGYQKHRFIMFTSLTDNYTCICKE
eukprot:sb/3475062/